MGASCHSLDLVHYRDLVGVCYTEEEAKEMAMEIEVMDGPDDEGEMFERRASSRTSSQGPTPTRRPRASRTGAPTPRISARARRPEAHGGQVALRAQPGARPGDLLQALEVGAPQEPQGRPGRHQLGGIATIATVPKISRV